MGQCYKIHVYQSDYQHFVANDSPSSSQIPSLKSPSVSPSLLGEDNSIVATDLSTVASGTFADWIT